MSTADFNIYSPKKYSWKHDIMKQKRLDKHVCAKQSLHNKDEAVK